MSIVLVAKGSLVSLAGVCIKSHNVWHEEHDIV